MPKGFKKDGSYAGKIFRKGQVSLNKGKKASIRLKEKMSISQKKAHLEGKYNTKRNDKIRESMKKLYSEGKTKISDLKGKNHPNWKGGVSFEYHTERQILMTRSKYKVWREMIFMRDDFTCQCCGEKGIRIEAHHIKSWKDYPESRFDLNNGQTLCKECHREIHAELRLIQRDDVEEKLRREYGE